MKPNLNAECYCLRQWLKRTPHVILLVENEPLSMDRHGSFSVHSSYNIKNEEAKWSVTRVWDENLYYSIFSISNAICDGIDVWRWVRWLKIHLCLFSISLFLFLSFFFQLVRVLIFKHNIFCSRRWAFISIVIIAVSLLHWINTFNKIPCIHFISIIMPAPSTYAEFIKNIFLLSFLLFSVSSI